MARRFIRELCDRRFHVMMVFIVTLLFLLLQLPYLVVVEKGTAMYLISVVNVVGLVVFVSGSGWVLLQCRRLGE